MATTKTSSKQTEDFLKQSLENFTQNIDAMSCFAKDTVDAIVKSSSVATKGAEELMAEMLNCSKSNMENCVAVAKDLANARSVDQFVAIQTEQSKKYFENYVSQMTKMSEMMVSLSKDACSPINERVAAFSDKIMKKAA